MPYCVALSFSRTKFTSSIAILSESGGSSSRICRVCGAGLAVERLREEQQPHGRRHLAERLAKFFLIGRGDKRHPAIMTAWELIVRGSGAEQLVRRSAKPSNDQLKDLLRSPNDRRSALRRAGRRDSRRRCCWRACRSAARRSCAAVNSVQVLRTSFGATRAGSRGVLACTPSARWCRTTRTGCSCADRRRSASTAHRAADRQPTADCRSARSGTLRAPPSGSASSVRPRPAARVPARAPAAVARRRPVLSVRALRLVLVAALSVLAIVAHAPVHLRSASGC